MRFDDSLATVLAADTDSPHGAAAAWRQLVDLTARRRIDADAAIGRLRQLRARVPAAVRGASGRALAMVEPPRELVALFAEDDLAAAAPVLRTARLDAADWLALLPTLTPATRAVLRHRRDLPDEVIRGLESFGATDFVLGHEPPVADRPAQDPPAAPEAPVVESPVEVAASDEPRFEIADLVARIDAFRRARPEPAAAATAPVPPADSFQFHTDRHGVIRWVEGVARAPLIGVALGLSVEQGLVLLEQQAGAALKARRAFRDVVLTVGGTSSASGRWRVAAEPRFDRATGQFTGFAGIAHRVAAPAPAPRASDTLRELVHELRTPANAITGFAELIATEMLGPVSPLYRDRARLVQRQGDALAEAIADLDTAARIEGDALETRSGMIDFAAMATRAVADLQPMAQARHVRLALAPPSPALAQTDDRAGRRLVERLLAAVVAAALPGEQLTVQLVAKTRTVRLHVTRPRALPPSDDRLLAIDGEETGDEVLLLGIGFTLRLVRRLAEALGGALSIGGERLTLRLPAAVTAEVEQAAAQ